MLHFVLNYIIKLKDPFIDDYNRIPYPGGYVLNSVINADAIDYPVNDKISYLLGPRFHPLRRILGCPIKGN